MKISAAEVANLSTVIKLSHNLHTFRCGSYTALSIDLFFVYLCRLSFCHLSIFPKNINSVLSVSRRQRIERRCHIS